MYGGRIESSNVPSDKWDCYIDVINDIISKWCIDSFNIIIIMMTLITTTNVRNSDTMFEAKVIRLITSDTNLFRMLLKTTQNIV